MPTTTSAESSTYSQAGAQFGYSLLWLLVPITIALVVVQEMCARMGAVTGKGLADLIRENFGVKVTFWCLLLFVLGDIGNTATEFAGVASSAPIFGGYLHVPNAEAFKIALVVGAAIFVFLTVTRGTAKVVERIFFFFCFVYVAYVVSAFVVRPDWHDVLRQSIVPHFQASKAYILMIIAVIGTTISPWMQFYIQAAVVDKGVREDDYALFAARRRNRRNLDRRDRVLHHRRVRGDDLRSQPPRRRTRSVVNDVGDVAVALQPIAGKFAALLFAHRPAQRGGLYRLDSAAFDRLLRLRSLWVRARRRSPFREAPIFYGFYLALIIIGAGVVIIPGAPLLSDHLLLAGAQRHAACRSCSC